MPTYQPLLDRECTRCKMVPRMTGIRDGAWLNDRCAARQAAQAMPMTSTLNEAAALSRGRCLPLWFAVAHV